MLIAWPNLVFGRLAESPQHRRLSPQSGGHGYVGSRLDLGLVTHRLYIHTARRGHESSTAPLPALRAVKVLDQLRERLRYMHYSVRTEETYVH